MPPDRSGLRKTLRPSIIAHACVVANEPSLLGTGSSRSSPGSTIRGASASITDALLAEEAGSDLVAELWDGCDAAMSSRLAYPEVRAALAAARSNHDLGEGDIDAAEEAWHEFWAATRPVELTAAVEQRAGQLARQHALRGADAVHLASALAIGDRDLVIAVWDRRLHEGALAAGLRVAAATLDPAV